MKRQMKEVYRESQRDNALPSLHGYVPVPFISLDTCRITGTPLLVTRRTYLSTSTGGNAVFLVDDLIERAWGNCQTDL